MDSVSLIVLCVCCLYVCHAYYYLTWSHLALITIINHHCNCSAVSKLVLGMASIEQLHQNLSAIEEASRVPQEIWAEAKAIGLLEPHINIPAPTP